MKINWSLINRLGFNEPQDDEFASFSPQGDGAAASSSDGGAGDGAADGDDDESFSGDDDDDDDDDLAPATPAGGAPKQKRQAPQLDQDALVRQIAEVTARSLQQGQQPGQTPLTEDEIQKRLGRPTVTEELIARLRNPEITPKEMAEALQQLQDGTYRYAMTTTQHLLQHQLQPLLAMQQQFAEQQRQQRETVFQNNLTRAYPALKKYSAAVGQAMAELTAEGFSAKGLQPEQIYKTVAQRAKKVIRKILPDFALKQQQAPGHTRQAGSFRTSKQGQGNPGPVQKYGAASFDL